MTNGARTILALRSLDGLSVGDAFGECFFAISLNPLSHEKHLSTRTLPNWRWHWTDDTAMAISIVEILMRRGSIDQDELAMAFAKRYAAEDNRGYGGTAHGILRAIGGGVDWRIASPEVLSGMGSMGNGGAMRVAPLGAYFSDDPTTVVEHARRSAEITHAHSEGQAGTIGVALAAAFMASISPQPEEFHGRQFFDFILARMPDSLTRANVRQASELPSAYSPETAASVLGNGSRLTAPDTVPFCLWCAAKFPFDFENAMWTTVACGGDMDTNCAIVGGIIAAGEHGNVPSDWLARREPLPLLK